MSMLVLTLFPAAFGRSLAVGEGWVAEQWTVADGLPSDVVFAVAEDPRGGLLLGTGGGLARFDGRTFTTLHPSEPGGPPEDRVQALIPDPGGVWLVTETGAVQHRTATTTVDHGALAVVTRPVRIWASGPAPLVCTDHGVFELRDVPVRRTDLPPDTQGVVEDAEGTLVKVGGVWFNQSAPGGALVPVDTAHGDARFDAMAAAAHHSRGFEFGPTGIRKDGVVVLPVDWSVEAIQETVDATWIATSGQGLWALHPTPLRVHPGPGSSPGVSRVLADPLTQTVWANDVRHEHWWSPDAAQPNFTHVSYDGRVLPLGQRAGLLPLGTRPTRWWWTDEGLRRQTSPDDAPVLGLGPAEGPPCPEPPYAAWTAADGSHRVSNGDSVLGDTVRAGPRPCNEAMSTAHAAVVVPGSGTLLGGLGGLLLLPEGSDSPRPVEGPDHLHVRHLRIDDGRIWMATEGQGLCSTPVPTLDHPTWRCVGVAEGLDQSLVHASLADSRGYTWLSTNRGLRVAETRALEDYADGRRAEVPFLRLQEDWGLPTAELDGFDGFSALDSGDGRLWFPGVAGLVEVKPGALALPDRLSLVVDPPLPDTLPSAYEPVHASLHVTPLTWAPQATFRYRVGEGGWRATGADLTLDRFPPGDARVEVQARLIGDWQPVVSQVVWRTPTLTERPAFPYLVAVGSVLALAGVYLVRDRVARRRQAVLVAEVERQTAALSRQNTQLATQADELAARNAQISAQAAQLAQLDELKRRLIADLAHELRTPLTLVVGALDRGKPDVATARRNADRLRTLLDELFDLSRLHHGGLQLRAKAVDLRVFCSALAARFEDAFSARGRGLEVTLPETPLVAWADPHLLEKIVGNLLANALRHGAGRTELVLGSDDDWAVVEVTDEGPGIPPADRERIFERFVQLSTGDTRAREGAGIGLSLARELVELHGGELRVVEGATFRLRLPLGQAHLALDDVEPSEGPAALAVPAATDLTDGRAEVLLVEDNDELRTFMAALLGERWNVTEARDGREGLELAQKRRPGVVVTDVRTPHLDGLAMVRAMRADTALADVPVLFVSAKTQDEDRAAGLELGQGYLCKPFGSAELVARTQALLGAAGLPPEPSTRPEHEAAFLTSLEAVVTATLADPDFGVERLARKQGMSVRSLQERMKELGLPPPRSYLLEARLAAADGHLRAGRFRTVSEVAAAVGLSRAYFTRAYTAWAGHPPGRVAGGAAD